MHDYVPVGRGPGGAPPAISITDPRSGAARSAGAPHRDALPRRHCTAARIPLPPGSAAQHRLTASVGRRGGVCPAEWMPALLRVTVAAVTQWAAVLAAVPGGRAGPHVFADSTPAPPPPRQGRGRPELVETLGAGPSVDPRLHDHPVRDIARVTRPGTQGAGAFSSSVPGGVLAGNGDLGLVIGSLPDNSGPGLTFALGKNDFWGTFDHIFFGGTFEHFSPAFLTLAVGRAATPTPAAAWDSHFVARQQLRDGQLLARSYDASAIGSGGGYGLHAEAYVLSSRDVIVVNLTASCPTGVATSTVLANLSTQNSWSMPVRASRHGGRSTNEPVRLELRKQNRRSPSHPTVLAACTGQQFLINGLRTFALTGDDTIVVVNGSDTTSLCLEAASNSTRVHTVRCAKSSPRWRWDPTKRRVAVDARNESEAICLAVVNTNTTECPSTFPNQPPPRTYQHFTLLTD